MYNSKILYDNLSSKLSKIIATNFHEISCIQSDFRKKLYTTDIIFYLLGFGFGYLFFQNFLVGILFSCIFIFLKFYDENYKYSRKIKNFLFEKLLSDFKTINIYYKNMRGSNIENNNISNDEIVDSGLANYEIDIREDDDCFWGVYNNIRFDICTTILSTRRILEGEWAKYTTKFEGIIFKFELLQNTDSNILFIDKRLNRKIYPNYKMINNLPNNVNKILRVYNNTDYSSDKINDFNTELIINIFNNLNSNFKTRSINFAIYNNKLYIMCKTSIPLFKINNLFNNIDDISKYQVLLDGIITIMNIFYLFNSDKSS